MTRKAPSSEGHGLTCLEVWGGNSAIDDMIAAPGLDAWVYNRPHGGGPVGGDIYYVSMCACGEIARFFLADLSGHGALASKPADDVRRLMRRFINTLDQRRFVRSVNERMMDWERTGVFATVIPTTYFAPTRELIICNAGHPPPAWHRRARDECGWLEADSDATSEAADNLPVGVVAGTCYRQFQVRLDVGDRVLLYSDSAVECRDPSGREIGRAGLLRMFRETSQQSPEDQVRELVRRVVEHRGSEDLEDDLTFLLVHHHGEGEIQKSIGERLRTMGRMLGLRRG